MSGTSSYYLIAPAERINYVPNPSFEREEVFGTTVPWGWTMSSTNNNGFLTIVPTHQRFGVLSARLEYYGTDTGTVALTSTALPIVGSCTASCYVRRWTGVPVEVILSIGTFGAGTFQIGTQWQRVNVTTYVTGSNWVGITVRPVVPPSAGDPAGIYLDGVQLEQGQLTTYLDGDQDDCVWIAEPHRSRSYRPATTRSGGTMYQLAGLRVYPTDHAGVGMAPITNLAIDRSDHDGALYQRARSPERTITITTSIVGTSLEDLHRVRRRLIDVVKPNVTTDQQPLWLMYTGAGKELVLPVHYAGGLDVTDMGVVADTASLQFVAYDPIWREIGHQGTILDGWLKIAVGTVQGALWRDPSGRWGGLVGAYGTPFGTVPIVHHINADRAGTIIVCHDADYTGKESLPDPTHRISMMASGTWQRLTGTAMPLNLNAGVPFGTPYVTAWNDDRTHLFVGGRFGSVSTGMGTGLAMWRGPTTGSLGTWVIIPGLGTSITQAGGSPIVYDIKPYANGSMLVLGNFWCGTSQGAAWLRTSYLPHATVMPIAGPIAGLGGTRILHQAHRLGPHAFLATGSFTAPGGTAGGTHLASLSFAGGTPAWGTYRWQPASPLGGGVVTRSGEIYITVADSNPALLGHFRVRRGGATRLTGQSWAAITHMPPIPWGRPIAETRQGRLVMLVGTIPALGDYKAWWGTTEETYEALVIAEYAGGGWIPDLVIKKGTSGTIIPYGITESPTGTLYVWGNIWFSAWLPGRYLVHNTASHDVYPVITWQGGRVTALINRTTGDGIYGDLATASDERAYIDTRPDRARVWSEVQGDMTSLLLPTSRLAGFRIAPGVNVFQVHASVRLFIWWTPRYWSFDG